MTQIGNVFAVGSAGSNRDQYKVGVEDTTQLDRADLILYSGLHLEGNMGNLFARMRKNKPTFGVA